MSDTPTPQTTPSASTTIEKGITGFDVIDSVFGGYGEKGKETNRESCKQIISKYLKQEINKHTCHIKYNVLILHDATTLVRGDSDKIYNAVTQFSDKTKPILLILYSRGGSADSAYLIGQLCREFSNGSFIVSIPRIAKSAATLIACAANEIHMGSLSELGPIDPQIDQGTQEKPSFVPALGLKQSVEHIAKLVQATPEASLMFAQYLHLSLRLIDLGYYERIAESAEQYAMRLLETHAATLPVAPKQIAHKLVHEYKDHGFVIDKNEAEKIFSEKTIKKNTPEYELGNAVYKIMSMLDSVTNFVECSFYFIGSPDSEATIDKRREQNKNQED